MYKIAIFGAKSLALGTYEAVHFLYPETECIGFIVTSLEGNPDMLAGQKVWELEALDQILSHREKENLRVLIAVPEDVQDEIAESLCRYGFLNFICMDSHREAGLMGRYFAGKKIFPPLHLPDAGKASVCVYQVRCCGDRRLEGNYEIPEWVVPLQAGADAAMTRICRLQDNQGENISAKNGNYCELTALYWLWKNRLIPRGKSNQIGAGEETDYYGLYHYRRILDISEEDLRRMKAYGVDAVLPFPTLHEPDIREHHARYVRESDWEAMRQALAELSPEYAAAFDEILLQPYFYNYNLILARRQVLADYCAWLFPVLERTEELSIPKGADRADRYIGYLGENLETLYFLYHKDDLNIVHTGRIMFT